MSCSAKESAPLLERAQRYLAGHDHFQVETIIPLGNIVVLMKKFNPSYDDYCIFPEVWKILRENISKHLELGSLIAPTVTNQGNDIFAILLKNDVSFSTFRHHWSKFTKIIETQLHINNHSAEFAPENAPLSSSVLLNTTESNIGLVDTELGDMAEHPDNSFISDRLEDEYQYHQLKMRFDKADRLDRINFFAEAARVTPKHNPIMQELDLRLKTTDEVTTEFNKTKRSAPESFKVIASKQVAVSALGMLGSARITSPSLSSATFSAAASTTETIEDATTLLGSLRELDIIESSLGKIESHVDLSDTSRAAMPAPN